jgi:hypothetical protein
MYECKICSKQFQKEVSYRGHLSSHNRGENYKKNRRKNLESLEREKRKKEGYYCKFCNSEFIDGRKLGGHIVHCKQNPRYEIIKKKCAKGTKEFFDNVSIDWKNTHSAKISSVVKERMDNGILPKSFGRAKKVEYNGISLHGSWELKYAQWLDANSIKWRKPSESFLYLFEGKRSRYYPDFYLIETNCYVEVKGYKTKKDDAKWLQFPKGLKLTVLFKADLKQMGVL